MENIAVIHSYEQRVVQSVTLYSISEMGAISLLLIKRNVSTIIIVKALLTAWNMIFQKDLTLDLQKYETFKNNGKYKVPFRVSFVIVTFHKFSLKINTYTRNTRKRHWRFYQLFLTN